MEWIFRLLGLIPRKWAVHTGNFIGNLWFLVDKRHREIAIDNLSQAYKEKNPLEIRLLTRQVFKNLGQILFEVGWSLYLNPNTFHKYFDIRGLAHYQQAYQKNKGVLALTAHIGNWELFPIIGAMLGDPINIVYRPLDFPPLNKFFIKNRTRYGAKMTRASHAMRPVLKALKQREAICILLDQSVDWYEGVFVDFFSRRTCTNKGMALLALKSGAPVVPVFLVREGTRFIAEFGSEIPLIRTGDRTKDVEENTRQYNQAIEAIIRRYPEQWFWVHRRWKIRPYQFFTRQ